MRVHFKQFYLGCLAHASYLIGSDGDAAIVDPQRDVDLYLKEAGELGLRIRHVIETHLHADFVSGHRELAELSGARIYFGARAGAGFDHVSVRDGDEVRIGDVLLRFLETPGHTPESISVLVFDLSKSNEPMAVLTGDTLFIGDVGRPDLAGSGASGVELAGELYDSLHSKLLALPEHVRVFPAHGAGSLCGRNISGARSSTIGQERRFNYALRPMSREEFVRMMTVDLPEAPPYFRRDVELNRSGPAMLAHLPDPPGLSPAEVSTIMNQDYVLLDTRSSPSYGAGHIRGSLNVGLCGQFASWAGSLIRPDQPIILVVEDDGAVSEARTRLARVGLENVSGYLAGGIPAWDRAGLPLSTIDQISIDDLKSRLQEAGGLRVLDVRRLPEWKAGHISAAVHIPLHALQGQIGSVGRDEPLAVICAGGYRSSAATSILEQNGYTRVSNVIGGMSAWVASRYDVCT